MSKKMIKDARKEEKGQKEIQNHSMIMAYSNNLTVIALLIVELYWLFFLITTLIIRADNFSPNLFVI